MTTRQAGQDLDTSKAHSARMYDYFLGGKDHFEVDKDAALVAAQAHPDIYVTARENRAFMHRATRALAQEHGIRQWLDIGTGIPTEPNLHQVAQSVASDARVVYADNDPLVLKYAERLMRSTTQGRTAYVQADATDADALMSAVEDAGVLDFDQPIALSLNALMHFITDPHDPYAIVHAAARPAPGKQRPRHDALHTRLRPRHLEQGRGGLHEVRVAGEVPFAQRCTPLLRRTRPDRARHLLLPPLEGHRDRDGRAGDHGRDDQPAGGRGHQALTVRRRRPVHGHTAPSTGSTAITMFHAPRPPTGARRSTPPGWRRSHVGMPRRKH